jgi:hypothetical protein
MRRVSTIPSGDAALRDLAGAALRDLDRGVDPKDVGGLLDNALRPTYPNVEVHRQDPFAKVFEDEVWYVYREGKAPA